MPISLYDLSVPLFISNLTNLTSILKKAEQYADDNGIPHSDLLTARLAADMLPLTFQIQSCSNTSKNSLVRVADAEAVPMEDNESTFAELQARIAKTIDVLKDVDPSKFDGTEEKEVVMKFPGREFKFTGQSYLLTFAIPNFFFHATTAYDILRSKGVPLGKGDFLGSL
ncbi:hypothetical protein W97_09291 [Coniosporium apollinis CBS 100218]|uniref:DUF1993 domain-containing protein n=1 Tax=Coniosporium apollinis (strain CBS 100218) TaxID=1168221 RepID=R7Z769_CONA1|nr:uncharacterized protein W97_09291 [Coniosporium apollinis CBS 100218]EON70025.1 hypothetical protein W97_09291 [Coniosporium apollinis CBS 100218]